MREWKALDLGFPFVFHVNSTSRVLCPLRFVNVDDRYDTTIVVGVSCVDDIVDRIGFSSHVLYLGDRRWCDWLLGGIEWERANSWLVWSVWNVLFISIRIGLKRVRVQDTLVKDELVVLGFQRWFWFVWVRRRVESGSGMVMCVTSNCKLSSTSKFSFEFNILLIWSNMRRAPDKGSRQSPTVTLAEVWADWSRLEDK